MKKFRLLFLLLVISLPAILQAQSSVLLGERQLRKWSELIAADTTMMKSLSGEYFVFLPMDTARLDGPWRIGYVLRSRADDPRDIKLQLYGFFLPETLRVRLDDRKKVPTAELFLAANLAIEKVVIRISKGDYDKSPCLKLVIKEF